LNQEVKRIISDKPDFIKDNKYINKLYDQIDEDRRSGKQRKNMTLYHITDVHINADYKEGTNNKCNSFVCCTEESGVATKDKDRAGKWGDYLCDTNPRVIDQLQTAVGKTGMPDFVAWTGDSTGHQIHNNPFITTKATKQVTLILERIFEKSVVFPIHGNHEFAPFNIQDMSKKNSEEVELIADAWKDWMTPEVYQEFIHHSYFSYDAKTHPKASEEFKRKMDKVRIISINTQNCYTFNFKLIGEYNDPGQEFNWLENLLRQMEKDGEIAILIGHIPPGNLDCTQEFGMRMRALHDRFQHIIRLNLFGHTHYEEFEVHRGISDDLPIGTNHVSPSITTFVDQNPSFRVIILDEETLLPIEIQTYTMYLDKANKNDKDAKFVLDHEYTKQFGLKDLSPSSMLILSNKLRNYDDHATNYMINRLGGSPKAHYNMKKGCNER